MRLACRILEAILPQTVAGRSTLGDLIEEFHRRRPGAWRHLWFWYITLDLTVRYLPGRLAGLVAGFGRDLRHAARLFRLHPTLVLAAGVSLSLAIGVGTAAFSVANGAWLRYQMADDPSIVKIWRTHRTGASMAWPASELFELRRQSTLATLEGWILTPLPIGSAADGAAPESVPVSFVTGAYLSTFNASAASGRLLGPEDDRRGGGAVVVLSHLFWRRHFGGDRSIVGRTVWIAGSPFSVVGVADRDFIDPGRRPPSMWAPFAALELVSQRAAGQGATQPFLVGRLNHSATAKQVNAELTGLALRIGTPASPTVPLATGAEVVAAISEDETRTNGQILIGVLSVIALVLVLACANVSNLQLAGAAARRQEIAIRLACGASRRRVVRQLVTESVLLSASAGAIGLLLASWLSPLLAAGMGMPDADVDPDLRVYAFVAIASAIAAIGTGLAPAYYGARSDVSTSLKGTASGDGRQARSSRTRSIFIGVQAAASIVLVALAALLVRALVHIAWLEPGFNVKNLLAVSIGHPRSDEAETRARDFWNVAIARVRSVPGVERASLAMFVPFNVTLGDPDQIQENGTDSDYFATMGLRLLSGRSYTAAEVAAGERVAVISEQLARRFWGQENALGTSAARIDTTLAKFQVIGIVADALTARVHDHRTPLVYVPITDLGYVRMAIRMRDPGVMAGGIRDVMRELSTPDMRPTVTIVGDRFAREFERPRRYAALAAGVALFALVLSVVGLVGVTSLAVRTRTREIGIRLALGARGRDVIGLLVREGMRPVIVGLMVGLVGALLAGRLVAGLLYGLSERDPLALAGAVCVLLMAACAAVVIPTRRAAHLDPAVVLRD